MVFPSEIRISIIVDRICRLCGQQLERMKVVEGERDDRWYDQFAVLDQRSVLQEPVDRVDEARQAKRGQPH